MYQSGSFDPQVSPFIIADGKNPYLTARDKATLPGEVNPASAPWRISCLRHALLIKLRAIL